METLSVLITDPIDEEGVNILREAGFSVDYKPGIPSDQLKSIVSKYDALVVRSQTKVTKEIFDVAPNLKIIGRAGAGLDNIDANEAKKRGIKILNTPEAPAASVAELTIGLMISLMRRIPYADKSMKAGSWVKKECTGTELCGKTLGIIGLGRIGIKIAKIAKSMGMKILFHDIRLNTAHSKVGAKKVSLKRLLQASDIITIHIPLSSETQNFIGEKEIQLIKNGAYLINTSRGAIVNGAALRKALETGKLAGAALDVFEPEPPLDYSLAKMPQVVCTPHIGAQTSEVQKIAAISIARKIVKAARKR